MVWPDAGQHFSVITLHYDDLVTAQINLPFLTATLALPTWTDSNWSSPLKFVVASDQVIQQTPNKRPLGSESNWWCIFPSLTLHCHNLKRQHHRERIFHHNTKSRRKHPRNTLKSQSQCSLPTQSTWPRQLQWQTIVLPVRGTVKDIAAQRTQPVLAPHRHGRCCHDVLDYWRWRSVPGGSWHRVWHKQALARSTWSRVVPWSRTQRIQLELTQRVDVHDQGCWRRDDGQRAMYSTTGTDAAYTAGAGSTYDLAGSR